MTPRPLPLFHRCAAAALSAAALLSAAGPAPAQDRAADPVATRVVDTIALPRFDALSHSAAALAQAAKQDCRAAGLRAAWGQAMDAWIPAQAFRAGPLEKDGRGLAIAFWPDPKGATDRALRRMLAGEKTAIPEGAAYGEVTVAARGLYALEAMLFDPGLDSYGPEDPGCRLVRAATEDLAATTAAVARDWHESFAPVLLDPAASGDMRFLDATEVRQSLFTQLLTQLGFDAETRLGRPLGSPARPRPLRAESRAPARALHNVSLSLAANEALARALTADGAGGSTEYLFEYFDYARSVAEGLGNDPVFAGVEDPTGRMRVEELKTAIERVHDAASTELGAELGVSAGFNALDGD